MTTTIIHPQEIYLLERYISLEYFGELRDAWGTMVKHVETCLDQFMQNLPLDYRNRPLSDQPDAVWGERVLPNFRDTFQGLCDGYIRLSHGDMAALHYAHGVTSDFKGQMDFWSGWMSEEDEEKYRDLMSAALTLSSNIKATEGAYWDHGDLTWDYDVPSRGPLNPPPNWPSYRSVSSVKASTGERLLKSGIYLPDIDDSCAQFLSIKYNEAPEASVFVGMSDTFDPVTQTKDGEEPRHENRPCTWTLIERVSDTGGRSTAPSLLPPTTHRVTAGESCPETGYYFTPARADSRRRFEQGEIMPDFESGYGLTIWQWDQVQD